MSNQQNRDDALFEQLGKSKKKRKRKILITIVSVVLVIAIILVAGVAILQRRVREQFASMETEVEAYEAATGTISTLVSGSGTLSNVDTESVEIPTGVTLKEVLVSYGDSVEEGQLLATADQTTVRSAMAELQTQIEALDEEISDAEGDKVSANIKAGVTGRVKQIFAGKGDDIASVMAENGALALLSLDGCLAVDIETDALSAGDTVTVELPDGDTEEGTVESAAGGKATVLITDNGPLVGDTVTVMDQEGTALGTGELYIHSALAITGYAGTVSQVYTSENAKVSSYSTLFYLTDTETSVNYDTLLRSRTDLEEQLMTLLDIQRNGGITAPISGSIIYAAKLDTTETLTALATISPDISMSVTITVDESDILSLELGQEADVTVSSVSEDSLTGIVTEIDTTGESGSYTAVVTLDKVTGMLPGMTASVDVKIQGVEDAILIPVEALHQTSGGYYVYTSYNEETQEYGGRVDVTVGLSNDDYVEITSGLSVGDTVYYTEQQSIFDMFGGMGGMSGMSGMGGSTSGRGDQQSGGMPDMGGERPSGGIMPGGFGG